MLTTASAASTTAVTSTAQTMSGFDHRFMRRVISYFCSLARDGADTSTTFRRSMLRDWNSGRFNLVQMILACVLCIGVAGAAARYRYRAKAAPVIEYPAHPESQALKEKYGPHRNSYSEEEWCIRDFFNDTRDGFFVDVGANDYKVTSNTYYL